MLNFSGWVAWSTDLDKVIPNVVFTLQLHLSYSYLPLICFLTNQNIQLIHSLLIRIEWTTENGISMSSSHWPIYNKLYPGGWGRISHNSINTNTNIYNKQVYVRPAAGLLADHPHVQLQHARVGLLGARLVQHRQPQRLGLVVRPRASVQIQELSIIIDVSIWTNLVFVRTVRVYVDHPPRPHGR